MKKILSLLTFLSLCACSIQYDGETRLVFQARVNDSQGNPKADLPVSINISDGEISDMISNGNTNSNGEITLIFPAPSNIDANISIDIGNLYSYALSLQNLKRSDFTNYKLAVDNYVLYNDDESTFLSVEYNPSSNDRRITAIRIEGDVANEWFYWNQFGESSLEFGTEFNVVKNSNVLLIYTVTDTSVSPASDETFTVPLVIGNDNVSYTINY
jgi:hypothetical protein